MSRAYSDRMRAPQLFIRFMTFVSVPTYLEKTTHSTPADPQIRSANAPDARHGDALADAGIVVRPLAAADFQAVMDAYYQQWGMEDDGDPVVSGWWTAALFEKASFGCLAWKGDELFGAAVGHARSMKSSSSGAPGSPRSFGRRKPWISSALRQWRFGRNFDLQPPACPARTG